MKRGSYNFRRKSGFIGRLNHTKHFSNTSFYGLSGRYILRLLFLFFIGLFYVGNTHHYEKVIRRLRVLEQEVDTLRVDYTTLQADYAFDCKQSEIARKVASMCLYEVPHPPLKISSR